MKLSSKNRAMLKSLAQNEEAVLAIGKDGVTANTSQSALEAFNTRELLKINVLKSCLSDINQIAEMISERTHSTVVQVIGRKIVLYKPFKDKPVIKLVD